MKQIPPTVLLFLASAIPFTRGAQNSSEAPGRSVVRPSETISAAPALLDHQHVDIGFAFEEGQWEPHIHNETDDLEYAPGEAVLILGSNTFTRVPADANYAFLGDSCAPLWLLPSTQSTNRLFLGFGAEEIGEGVFRENTLQVNLLAVNGPGRFYVYDIDAFGAPIVHMNSADGIGPDDARQLVAGSHNDSNWAFTAAGEYQVTFEAVGTLSNGTVTSSGPVDFTFRVEAAPGPTSAPPLTISPWPGQGVELAWVGASGMAYQLQTAEEIPGEWTDLGPPVVGECGPQRITVQRARQAVFFRLAVRPVNGE